MPVASQDTCIITFCSTQEFYGHTYIQHANIHQVCATNNSYRCCVFQLTSRFRLNHLYLLWECFRKYCNTLLTEGPFGFKQCCTKLDNLLASLNKTCFVRHLHLKHSSVGFLLLPFGGGGRICHWLGHYGSTSVLICLTRKKQKYLEGQNHNTPRIEKNHSYENKR